MKTNLIKKLESTSLKSNIPDFRIGDDVKVYYKIIEGDKERIQPFEGTLIAKKGTGITKSVVVRKISFGEGVERTFPLHSPRVEKIEITRRGAVRRAKLYYLRDKIGKKAKIKEKKVTESLQNEPAKAEEARTEPVKA